MRPACLAELQSISNLEEPIPQETLTREVVYRKEHSLAIPVQHWIVCKDTPVQEMTFEGLLDVLLDAQVFLSRATLAPINQGAFRVDPGGSVTQCKMPIKTAIWEHA